MIVVGIVANENYEGEVYIHAKKGVILTAGGFCNNKSLLDKYIPTAAMGCASSYLVLGETGECFRMGLGVNADVSGFNSSASFDGGVDWASEGKEWARFLYDGMTQLSRQPWFTIDRAGNRLRYMDSRVGEDGAAAIYALGDLATVQMSNPGHRGYIIFDGKYEDYLAGFSNTVIWLIVSAFLFAQGFIKTGLGRRIAYYLILKFGSSSLKLAYTLVLSDFIIAPATPSNTARSGGILFPIVRSLASVFGSEPGATARKIGAFLLVVSFQVDAPIAADTSAGVA